jgi:hypothetical protein
MIGATVLHDKIKETDSANGASVDAPASEIQRINNALSQWLITPIRVGNGQVEHSIPQRFTVINPQPRQCHIVDIVRAALRLSVEARLDERLLPINSCP